ncbi:MAG TPA: FkbM family methyltransferase [Candidatus Polarisedimenticolia bacterium]|nr:FkbM family methyltransferase [Candidatus Polarisedimenticolia bacterium]
MQVDLGDRIQRAMWGGCYEPHVRRCLAALIRPGDSILEVGAHIGYLTTFEALCVGPQGRVFAFEADPDNYSRLSSHTRGVPWVSAVRKAVWESSGTLIFERSATQGESGWGTLTSVRDLRAGAHIPVEAISLDDWLTTETVTAIHGLKIDAEGSETAILKGARRFLNRFRPWLILETNDILLRQASTSARELIEVLDSYGYSAFAFDWSAMIRVHKTSVPDGGEVLCVPTSALHSVSDALRRAGFEIDRGSFA